MNKQIKLNNAKEILELFEAHPKLSFDQMQDIINAYTGNKIKPIVFVPADKSKPQDLDRPKRELLQWVKNNLKVLDDEKALVPVLFFTTFKHV
ncbi:hypothetical protein APS56_04090 [Pseudalgibacter alginicilyticus]|uniref:Uncharacterized protein n=1 Tax=Pseudalgibacter alginicilyticus TaxID=1736674 RepID=A0A0P0D357_9FLAO|nr:hypothetical protein [Pseudalgibacter alginicilyticus]ALJ04368.1 hypothetical protein APS56_04090 [Pseudalgibacter alginicilyticus]